MVTKKFAVVKSPSGHYLSVHEDRTREQYLISEWKQEVFHLLKGWCGHAKACLGICPEAERLFSQCRRGSGLALTTWAWGEIFCCIYHQAVLSGAFCHFKKSFYCGRQNSKLFFLGSPHTAKQHLLLHMSRNWPERFSLPGKRSWVSFQTACSSAIKGCCLLYFPE